MVLTVTEDTPADMLAGSMELLVQLPREHHLQTQRVTVQRSTPMMDLLVQIATAHKLAASSYTLQAIGERGLVLPHQPNTPIGALDALQVKLLPKQGTFVPRKTKQANQPFETTFRLQVHLPRNQLYVSRVSPKMNLGEILEEVCREKNLDKNKYELRHPANLEETLDLSLSLQDYHLQEVTLYAKQGRTLGSALSTQDIMALQRQEERRRQQAKQGVFGFVFKKSKEGSLSTDSLGGRSASPARSDETGRSASPLQPPARPQRKRRPAPKPPIQPQAGVAEENADDSGKDKVVISHSRNSSDSSGYHEASVLSDNPDSAGRLPETLPRRSRPPMETPRKLAQTSQSSKSLGNLATVSGTLARGISSTSLSSAGLRKKRAAPPPPVTRPLSSAISTQALERIVDSEESLTSDMDPSKPPSDIGAPSKANSDIEERPKANSDIGVTTIATKSSPAIDYKAKSEILTTESKAELQIDKQDIETLRRSGSINVALSKKNLENTLHVEEAPIVEARVTRKRAGTDLSDTDILLQKVSDTLSNTLPVSSTNEKLMSSNVTRVPPMKTEVEKTNVPSQMAESTHRRKPVTKEDEPEEKHGGSDSPDGTINVNTSNMTLSSQQDTSDYVSAVDEDLLIAEWEYQLPAPPSAFRDNTSPIFDSYDSVIVRSVDTTKELGKKKATDVSKTSNKEFKKSKESCNVRGDTLQKASNELLLEEAKKGVSENKFLKQSQKLDSSLKKEMINELENKIGSLPQTAKDFDSKRVVDSSSTPKVAPVDNTLSNFTITTYTRQKNLNIFNEVEQQSSGKTDDRFVRSFATLSRNRNHENSEVTIGVKEFSSATLQNKKKVDKNETTNLNIKSTKLEPKMHDEQESLHRWQPVNSGNEKINIQRSKSYVSTCDKGKYGETCESKDTEYTGNRMEGNNVEMKKATSISNLSANRNNEKFSQWRDNILKRQEEPTKEKQLQSLQVLKSILPQLKSAQQAEENVSKEYNGTVLTEETRSETATSGHSMESNVVSTRDSQAASNSKNSEVESKKLIQEANAKRYTYSGPPAINLGSWSERPSVNVQIKTDMDYKLGAKKITNGRTIVNINGARDERDYINCIDDTTKSERNPMKSNGRFEGRNDYGSTDKKEPDELTKKFITHTTAAGFKKPILNKVNIEPKTMLVNDKPIVTGVELKKTFREKAEAKDDDSVIDTSPVNFKELTKAFGQDVYLRSKPKRSNMNRHSDLCIGQSETIKQVDSRKQNGHVHFEKSISTNDQSLANGGQANLRPKRFTSIVGIQPHNQGQNFTFRNAVNIKSNQPMPVVKGFKIQASNGGQGNQNGLKENLKDTSNCNTQPPKPPTMPVITGVTLKNNSVRPKSMPAQVNPRDMLLESIRNFGGREKLKSSAERC